MQIARGLAAQPPLHLKLLFRELQRSPASAETRILDHGCGGGLTCLILIACGYKNTYGIDIDEPQSIAYLNTVTRLPQFGCSEDHFFDYDGTQIPFADGAIDLIFSQQVVEHVTEPFFESFWSEEYRVLSADGIALHQIPHALTPYDSHTRTWLIHMLPKTLRPALYRMTKNDPAYVESFLALRWPWVIRHAVRHIGFQAEDITTRRLALALQDAHMVADYEGPRRLRSAMNTVFSAPVVGQALMRAVAPLSMMELRLTR